MENKYLLVNSSKFSTNLCRVVHRIATAFRSSSHLADWRLLYSDLCIIDTAVGLSLWLEVPGAFLWITVCWILWLVTCQLSVLVLCPVVAKSTAEQLVFLLEY